MEQQVAIVTAAGRGIGAACARELANIGYNVVLMSRSEDAALLACELNGTGIQGSVTTVKDLQTLVKLAVDTYGKIDAVVNNTGDPARADLLELTACHPWAK
jgi:NAD(P)-dependent dehydrogenase (short-subunit alcohol dehydrogenase family)